MWKQSVSRKKRRRQGGPQRALFRPPVRSFTLANEIDNDKAEAKYSDGVLELTLPKKAGGNGKKLVVS